MAGDWIKMRIELQTHPKTVRIMSATQSDKFRVIGGLHAVWSVFDAHSEDGKLKGYTPDLMDQVIGWTGFARAMEAVGWLVYDGLETLAMPEFEEHNGKSGKRRAEDQKRKRESRKSVRNLSGEDADEKLTREEKRREEDTYTSPTDVDDSQPVTEQPEKRTIPVKEILSAYHEHLPMMPAVRMMTETRKKKLKARWLESEDRQNIDYWKRFFSYVAQSDFLTGRSEAWSGCDFEWLIESKNHVRIIEGRYENRKQHNGSGS